MQKSNVLQLERTILYGGTADVAAAIREYGPFEFTARALALSARFGDADKTLMLIKSGASLDYDTHSNILRLDYNTIFSTSEIWGEDYPARYFLMPVFDRVTERPVFFGTLFDAADDLIHAEDGAELSPAPEALRAESAELLCRYGVLNAIQRETLLQYAILFGCEHIAEVLSRYGTPPPRADLGDSFMRLINSFEDIRLADAASLLRVLELTGASFTVSDDAFSYMLRYDRWLTERWGDFLTLLTCGHAAPQRIADTALKLIELDRSDSLAELAPLFPPEQLDGFIDAAISGGRGKCTAFLLNLKHKGS